MNPRHRLFANYYVALKFDGKAAALNAGYAAKNAASTASKLLTRPDVQEIVKSEINRILTETDRMTLEWLNDVTRIQRADLRKIVEWGPDGIAIKPSDELDDDSAYAISEISESVSKTGNVTTKVKLESKTRALELKGKYLAILSDNPPENELPEERNDRNMRRERIAALLAKRDAERASDD